ncbi:flagellar motor switch protein FliN, partial [Mesorhizobium sp. M2D.F.Ca.ET.145.01.1.1]
MAKTKVEPELDQPDEQLDRAIEELRGVLHEEEQRPEMAA